MILYEVTAEVDDAIFDAFERYMVEHHVPDLLATGCFTGARVCRDSGNQLRMSYEAPDEASLQRYLSEFSQALREDVLGRFPSGVTLNRSKWWLIESWEGESI